MYSRMYSLCICTCTCMCTFVLFICSVKLFRVLAVPSEYSLNMVNISRSCCFGYASYRPRYFSEMAVACPFLGPLKVAQ